jgi:ABC-type multidrug transport system fused ATPase/permease subunit
VVLRYRIHLEQKGYAPNTINLRLAAVRRVAYEASGSGLLSLIYGLVTDAGERLEDFGSAVPQDQEARVSVEQVVGHATTWAKRGSQPQIPTRGERNTQKIFGAVRLDNASFIYLHQEDHFQ